MDEMGERVQKPRVNCGDIRKNRYNEETVSTSTTEKPDFWEHQPSDVNGLDMGYPLDIRISNTKKFFRSNQIKFKENENTIAMRQI